MREIAEQWTNINFTEKNPDFISSCIWHNSLIRIESRPFFYRTWFNAGVEVVGNLLDKEGNFLSYNNFISKFNIKTNYLEYYKIISTVTQYKKVCSPALEIPYPSYKYIRKKILSSMEIERQIAKDSNTLNAFKKKWTRLKSAPE